MTATIRIFDGEPDGSDGVVLELSEDVVTVGRSAENHIRLNERLASRMHCQFERAGDDWKLVDLESHNGTQVNGTKVNFKVLENGDRVEIGEAVLVFEDLPDETPPKLRPLRRRRSRRRPKVRRPRIRPAGATEPDLEERFVDLLEEISKTLGHDGLADAESIFNDYLDRGEGGRIRDSMDKAERLGKLVDIAKAVNSERNLRRLLNLILDEAVRLTDAERGFLVLVEAGELRFEAARNFDRESVRKPEYKISRSVAEKVAKSATAIVSADAQHDARLAEYMSVSELRLRSLICVPLMRKRDVVGVLYLDNRFGTGVFTDGDRQTLEAFGDLAAIALENARLNEENLKRAEELARAKTEAETLSRLLAEKLEARDQEVERIRAQLRGTDAPEPTRFKYAEIVGESPAMQEVFRLLDRVVLSEVPVLVEGESGTGKELVAKAIHYNGPRQDKPFISENCAAIPETLLESELFGYKKGAFTGAVADKKGLFEIAHGGTLFLDEIAEMSQGMQKKLLRALQEGEIRVVGGKDIVKVNVRLVAASNRNLKKLVESGEFREDLFYRINVLQVVLPPLRERREDIPILVEHFLDRVIGETGASKKSISRQAMALLLNHDWPGNVRELENEIRRACAVSDAVIDPADLSPQLRKVDAGVAETEFALKERVKTAVEAVEREAILAALEHASWKKSETARLLGISRPTLDAKIDSLGIQMKPA